MKKLLILSGKGGTGKTTTAAAFVRFSETRVLADCDVDAPNLHLVTDMETEPENTPFRGSDKAWIDPEKCIGCGQCAAHCRFGAIRIGESRCSVEEHACEGCAVCRLVCPAGAMEMRPDDSGTLTLYRGSRVFSTATLRMGRGNSGKLVTAVKTAMQKAAPADAPLAILDGSPGIGCPVIASVTGVSFVLIVAEPSYSGLSDLRRILKTAGILNTKAAVCVNKYDVSPENAAAIEQYCREEHVPFVGRIPYDPHVSEAVNAGRSIADYDCPARDALRAVYARVMELMGL